MHALTASPSLSPAEENFEPPGGSVALSVSAHVFGSGTGLFWSISWRDYSIRHALEDELNLEASRKMFHGSVLRSWCLPGGQSEAELTPGGQHQPWNTGTLCERLDPGRDKDRPGNPETFHFNGKRGCGSSVGFCN